MNWNYFLYFVAGIGSGVGICGIAINYFSCNHEWTKWEHYLVTMQKRKCKKCGLRQERD